MKKQVTKAETGPRPEMPPRPPADSLERVLAQVGDSWTFLILREAFFGVRRFDGFQARLAAAPTVLADRLKKLVANGLLEKRPYQQRPPRFDYCLTEKGLDLYPAVVLLLRWGDRWLDQGRGAPLLLVHRPCGAVTRPRLVCDVCDAPIAARDMAWRPGPGGRLVD